MKGILLGLLIGGLAGAFFGRRSLGANRMHHRREWEQRLAAKRGAVEAACLMARAEARYRTLFAARPRFSHRALRSALARDILPGLALYQTLREAGAEERSALEEIQDPLVESLSAPMRRLMKGLRYVPDFFAGFRRAAHWLMRWSYPAAGWEIHIVENNDQHLALDIKRCFVLETLKHYGAPELTSLFCAVDDRIYEDLAPAIRWERSSTLARGGSHCDFSWRRGG